MSTASHSDGLAGGISPIVAAVSASVVLHAGLIGLLATLGPRLDVGRERLAARSMLLVDELAPDPGPVEHQPPPPPAEPQPLRASEPLPTPPEVRPGVDDGQASAEVWLESTAEGEHRGVPSSVTQPALTQAAGVPTPAASDAGPSPATETASEPPSESAPQPEPPTSTPSDTVPVPPEPLSPEAREGTETQAEIESQPADPVAASHSDADVLDPSNSTDSVTLASPTPTTDSTIDPTTDPAAIEPVPPAGADTPEEPVGRDAPPSERVPEPAPTPIAPPQHAPEAQGEPSETASVAAARTSAAEAAPETDPAAPSPASTPSRPAPGGSSPGDRPFEQADRDSDPTWTNSVGQIRFGRVLARDGIEIQPTRPRFSHTVRLTTIPRNPTVRITFNRAGRVTRAEFLPGRNTGYPEVDGPLLSAMYRWTAKGKKLRDAGPEGITMNFRVLLREERELGESAQSREDGDGADQGDRDGRGDDEAANPAARPAQAGREPRP